MSKAPTILVFDSGFGGLTVFREVVRQRPDAEYIYCADDAAFPYGRLGEGELIERGVEVFGALIESFAPDLAVIACNTASTIMLPHLRQRFSIPFVGTVPAIKPAAQASQSRHISVLATPGTVARDYTRELVREYGGECAVKLVGAKQLARLAEAKLRGEPVLDEEILAEIMPCFVTGDDGRRTDHVVLACTHYPLLAEEISRLAPWPVTLVDPAPAIARRVSSLLGPMQHQDVGGARAALFTGVVPQMQAERDYLAHYGVSAFSLFPMPFSREDV